MERTKFIHDFVIVPLTLKNLSFSGTSIGKHAGWDKAGGIVLPLAKQQAIFVDPAIKFSLPLKKLN